MRYAGKIELPELAALGWNMKFGTAPHAREWGDGTFPWVPATLRPTESLQLGGAARLCFKQMAVVIVRIARNAAFGENRKPNFRYCDLLAPVSNETPIR